MEKNNLIKYERGLVQYVGNAVNITNKLVSVDLRPLKILYLDDHSVYTNGTSKCILEKYPNANIEKIQDGNKALEYVTNSLQNKISLNLIITDHFHPGLSGLDFAKAVRIKEMEYDQTIPILFITMHSVESFIQQVSEIPFTKYLSKSAWGEEIKLAINNLI